MLDLIKAMEITNRLCEWMVQKSSCASCPCYNEEHEECCFQCWGDIKDWAEIERRLIEWDKEHPIPQYPTWKEWQSETFPGATYKICPRSFVPNEMWICGSKDCVECMLEEIPADIATKLGIKPKGAAQ